MKHSDVEEVVAAYVLGSIPDEIKARAERDLVEHLPGCESCTRLYRDLRDTAADIALSARPVVVPAAVEARIMGALRGERAAPEPQAKRFASFRRTTIIATAAAAIVALGVWNLTLHSALRHQRAPLARAMLMNKATGKTAAIVAIGNDGKGVLVGQGLDSIPAGKVFELWLLRSGSAPVAAGVFRPNGDLTVFDIRATPGRYDAAAITIENAPRGADKPTSKVVYSGTLA